MPLPELVKDNEKFDCTAISMAGRLCTSTSRAPSVFQRKIPRAPTLLQVIAQAILRICYDMFYC